MPNVHKPHDHYPFENASENKSGDFKVGWFLKLQKVENYFYSMFRATKNYLWSSLYSKGHQKTLL